VSTILKILVEERTPFAIKGGGNARGIGSSNANGGVTIDLRRLNEVEIASDRKSVKIGAGMRWGDVYSILDPKGLTVFGGRIPMVGISGLLLSGEPHLSFPLFCIHYVVK
jgi:FAD/FMN-containing dehydrogenase